MIQLEGRDDVTLEAGDFYVVPKGVRHNPIAAEEVGIVLIETVTTAHTGDVVTERTKSLDEQLSSSGRRGVSSRALRGASRARPSGLRP